MAIHARVCFGLVLTLGLAATRPVAAMSERVSVSSTGEEGNGNCHEDGPAISADGRFVAFWSAASNLVDGDTNGSLDVFVHDRQTHLTERVSVDSSGAEGIGESARPAISADGRFVAFESVAPLAPPFPGGPTRSIFVRDRLAGTTEMVSLNFGGNTDGSGNQPAISADGRFVTYWSGDPSMVSGDTNDQSDVFVRDRQLTTTERVSVDSTGTEANGPSFASAISGDGRFVAFESDATNLVAGDTNGSQDIFVHDRQTGATERVSVSSTAGQANDFSYKPTISSDGRFVAFWSAATNLVADDTNGFNDVFVHDRQTGTTERVSVSSAGVEADSNSNSAAISADGRFVVFVSLATNLDSVTSFAPQDIFIHDRQTGTTDQVSLNPNGHGGNFVSFAPVTSSDGHLVAFWSAATDLVADDTNGFADIFVAESVCGDGAIDFGEDCDDGNTLDGDCCSSSCHFEAPGSACSSDGNVCTNDQCNAAGVCIHPANSAPCDDGFFCNGTDTCGGGSCSIHSGNPCAGGPACADACNEAADNCLRLAGTPCTSDGNACTDDQCDGTGACTHPPNTAPCDDGLFCNGPDTCSGGSCVHAGDPCVGGGQCADLCNESADTCLRPNGTPCNDNDACTQTDTCQSGSCAGTNPVVCTALDQCHLVGTCNPVNGTCSNPHAPDGTTCDDGNACTQTDTCLTGICTGGNAAVCGDGSALPGCEQCDDGNTSNMDACKNDCSPNVCGDGVVHTGVEECDDGGVTAGDGCDANCMLEPKTVTNPSVAPGGSLSTDTGATGATASEPVQAAATTPTGGAVTITRTSSSTPTPGFTILTGTVHIDAPPAAAASDPLVLTFQLDASLIPTGEDETTIQISKDGLPVPACTGSPGVASPDPCVSTRVPLAGGDVELTVLTTTASDWALGVSLCPKTPSGGCKQAATGLLLVEKTTPDAGDIVVWKWLRGAVTPKDDFGSPLTTTDYALCVYDENGGVPGMKLRPVAAHGGLCGGKPCWKEASSGFRYSNTALTPDGKLRVVLHEGLDPGKAKITVTGKGSALGVPTLPFVQGPAVKVELRTSDGGCWEATYSTHVTNSAERFKAKSD